jgi:hypothetical protein
MPDLSLWRWVLLVISLRVLSATVGIVPLPKWVPYWSIWWVLVGLVWWSVRVS